MIARVHRWIDAAASACTSVRSKHVLRPSLAGRQGVGAFVWGFVRLFIPVASFSHALFSALMSLCRQYPPREEGAPPGPQEGQNLSREPHHSNFIGKSLILQNRVYNVS